MKLNAHCIIWADSTLCGGWSFAPEFDTMTLCTAVSIGQIYEETDDYIKIFLTSGLGGDIQYAGKMIIPKEAVIGRWELGIPTEVFDYLPKE